jgi:hypothetical protein
MMRYIGSVVKKRIVAADTTQVFYNLTDTNAQSS